MANSDAPQCTVPIAPIVFVVATSTSKMALRARIPAKTGANDSALRGLGICHAWRIGPRWRRTRLLCMLITFLVRPGSAPAFWNKRSISARIRTSGAQARVCMGTLLRASSRGGRSRGVTRAEVETAGRPQRSEFDDTLCFRPSFWRGSRSGGSRAGLAGLGQSARALLPDQVLARLCNAKRGVAALGEWRSQPLGMRKWKVSREGLARLLGAPPQSGVVRGP